MPFKKSHTGQKFRTANDKDNKSLSSHSSHFWDDFVSCQYSVATNNLDSGQTRQKVQPKLDPNRLITDVFKFMKKLILKISNSGRKKS